MNSQGRGQYSGSSQGRGYGGNGRRPNWLSGHNRSFSGNRGNRKRPYNQIDRSLSNNTTRDPVSSTHDAKKFRMCMKNTDLLDELNKIRFLDSGELLLKVFQHKMELKELLKSRIKNPNYFVTIINLVAQLKQCAFKQLTMNLLSDLEIQNHSFIEQLSNYLMDLPSTQTDEANNLYWKNQDSFWKNILNLYQYLISVTAQSSLFKYRTLIEATTPYCLEKLQKIGYVFPNELKIRLTHLTENLNGRKKNSGDSGGVQNELLQSFRELSVVPELSDLLDTRPFLRPNIVNGSYTDVEHYLDVQFRLLREDCFGPLREGIHQYMEEPNRNKFDHIRVYHNVKFVGPYITNSKLGTLIQLNSRTRKGLQKVNWARSKRFIFGSLLLFTNDNCKTFISGTILEREEKLLLKGQIPISIIQSTNDYSQDEQYTMIESEVYFEPYYHVLNALKDPKFPEHLAMSKYIVDVNPEPKYPKYIEQKQVIKLKGKEESVSFNVLEDNTWPTAEKLRLNQSQYDAFRLALSHEFAVLQGPPGTGKTYLGVKVAATLIENFSDSKGCLLLVICYTNHALDQFLEALLPITNSIIRIGGQSRNDNLNHLNLNNIRKSFHSESVRFKLYKQYKVMLKTTVFALKNIYDKIATLNSSIFNYVTILKYVPECKTIKTYYTSPDNGDPMMNWLFEFVREYDFDSISLNKRHDSSRETENDRDQSRNETILDNLFDNEDFEGVKSVDDLNTKVSFTLVNAEKQLDMLIEHYNTCRSKYEAYSLKQSILKLNAQIELFKERRSDRSTEVDDNVNLNYPPSISVENRWNLYFKWADTVIKDIESKTLPLQKSLEFANMAYEEARMMTDLEIVRNSKVVGITTSGAARLRKLLRELAPRIVIVEEAAEVLEAHIVTSLTKSCEHLILIGDHQQLRPSAAHVKLARRYNIEVSLFERMIMNKMHSRRLDIQHRMRPEIASLIVPHIYPDLKNHPSVEKFPPVRGMCQNLFFFSHNYKEEIKDSDDNMSKSNHREADIILGLANYIMQQGYKPEDVTILTAYSGQMFYMKSQRDSYSCLKDVKIVVVDNYQGEESRIILLSLVRNNDMDKIGFLHIKNRVCVALSRAREGLYIFGNIDILKRNSEIWVDIANTLEKAGSLGTSLNLKCKNHPDTVTTISCPDDFGKVPQGGCLLPCISTLKCNHPCPRICHLYDKEHVQIKCQMECERKKCPLGHVCPLKCSVKCEPCKVLVGKTLPCNHSLTLRCCIDLNSVKCSVVVDVTLPGCGHEAKKKCYMDPKEVHCSAPCEFRVDSCGHTCRQLCHVTKDPHHNSYKCRQPCARAKTGCTANLIGDRQEHQCRNMCYEPCEDCNVKVRKIVPTCGHEIEIECMKQPQSDMCKAQCKRPLTCSHLCEQPCEQPCRADQCTQPAVALYTAPCGHKVQLPCNLFHSLSNGGLETFKALEFCQEPCQATLDCSHNCRGTCAKCHQGRIHVPCNNICQQLNICGHQCEEYCNQACPPCKKPCQIRCPHSRCRNVCGAPCVPCQEFCKVSCLHGRCRNRCGEPCSRPPCSKRCMEQLPCGHRCWGLCGEKCMDACKICSPSTFPKDLLEGDFDDDVILIKLVDCGHVLGVDEMDGWMNASSDEVGVRGCPLCRTAVINTPRYKDQVMRTLSEDLNPIKKRVYGNFKLIAQAKFKITKKLNTLAEPQKRSTIKVDPRDMNYCLLDNSIWKHTLEKIKSHVQNTTSLSLPSLKMQSICLDVMELLKNSCEKYTVNDLNILRIYFDKHLRLILTVLISCSRNNKISPQQQKDIGNELKRINQIAQLSKLLSISSRAKTPEIEQATEVARDAVLSYRPFNEGESMRSLEQLQKCVKLSGIVSKMERAMVVKAIGLRAGHWFKCPNGHIYCIGECGGAMELSKCIECGVAIGGRSHALTAGNSHAPEVDGSRFPAWSNEYNNMANFNFD